jgi:hypothetical protein
LVSSLELGVRLCTIVDTAERGAQPQVPRGRRLFLRAVRQLFSPLRPDDYLEMINPLLAADLEGFLAQLHRKAEVSTVEERRRVLRLLVKDVLVGPRRSPSDTASQSANVSPTALKPSATPNRRATINHIAKCVGGVFTPPWGVPSSVGANPLPGSNTPAYCSLVIAVLLLGLMVRQRPRPAAATAAVSAAAAVSVGNPSPAA